MTIFEVYDFCMFSCCAASRFIKFTTRETRCLVIFPEHTPEERQFLRHHSELQTMKPWGSRRRALQDHPNQTGVPPRTYSNVKKFVIRVVPPQPLDTDISLGAQTTADRSSG